MVLVQMVLVVDDVWTDGLSAKGLSHCALSTDELRIDALSTETLWNQIMPPSLLLFKVQILIEFI